MPWFVLGLSGVTNSGKTTIAGKLVEKYPNAVHIKQDDYFLSEDDPRHVFVQGLGHQNWELLSSLDMDKMVDDIQRTLAVETTELRLLILDGFLLFMDPRTSNVCQLKIYLDLDFETCRIRRCTRAYDPPDVPGYFERVVWPEAQSAKRQALSLDTDIVVLDGKLPVQVILDILHKVLRRLVERDENG